jgi:hypothetical protein
MIVFVDQGRNIKFLSVELLLRVPVLIKFYIVLIVFPLREMSLYDGDLC